MTLESLENLVRIGQLKIEDPDQREFDGMLSAANRNFQDAQLAGLSQEGQFSLAYTSAHLLALAALRWHGYRSESRYLVFQCLSHTVGLAPENVRILDLCHRHRNLAEYEGQLDIPPQLLAELLAGIEGLKCLVEALGPVQHRF